MRVEALLAAAASPEPPPLDDLMPDPLLRDELPEEDLPWLLRLLPRADLYLQDEVEIALHPTLTRVWCRKGRRWLSRTRDLAAAEAFFRRTVSSTGCTPEHVVTGKAASWPRPTVMRADVMA